MEKSNNKPQINRQKEVNRAIDRHLSWYWKEETEKGILKDFGAEVLSEVRRLYDYVMSTPVDFKRYTLEQMVASLSEQLKNEYPFLSSSSVQRLTNCFAYAYK